MRKKLHRLIARLWVQTIPDYEPTLVVDPSTGRVHEDMPGHRQAINEIGRVCDFVIAAIAVAVCYALVVGAL